MSSKLYHRKVFWPKSLRLHVGQFPVKLTHHAERAQDTDRYGSFTIPDIINVSESSIFEAEVNEQGRVVKQCARLTLDVTRDIIVVMIPENGMAVLKTAWLNLRSDKHQTLKSHLYSRS
jgi:hypothetical protein